ncbi:MAG: hypothetical protein GF398_11500 [Chitinivibrionales bacterium]|nr:hypothetical protein [Chitinivibrionales bacterium]
MKYYSVFALSVLIPLLWPKSASPDVDINSGDMVVSEELCNISANDIALNLSLQYKAGIKLSQHASWVGLGFDISLPYVERMVIGSADEKSGSEGHCITYALNKDYNKLLLPSSNGYSDLPEEGDYTAQQDAYVLSAPFASGRIVFPLPLINEFTIDAGTDELTVESSEWEVGEKVLMTGESLPGPFNFDEEHEYYIGEGI